MRKEGLTDPSDLFARVFDAMPDGVVVVDGGGLITQVNRQMELLSGYPREELRGKPIEVLVPAPYRGAHETDRSHYTLAPARRAMGTNLDIHMRRKDRTEFPADISLSPVETDTGVMVVAAVRDISERRAAESALRAEQERFRQVVETVRDYAIFMLDPGGRVTTWNRGAAAINGYTGEEIVGQSFAVFYPPEDIAAGKPGRQLEQAAEEGRVEGAGWRVRKDGSRFWAYVVITPIFDESSALTGFSKITRDASRERRERERIEGLLAISDAILSGQELGTILVLIAARARSLVEGATGTVAIPAPDGDEYVIEVAEGHAADRLRGRRLPLGGSLTAQVLRSHSAVLVEDLSTDLRSYTAVAEPVGHGPGILLPLFVSGHDFGTLCIINARGGRRFTEEDLEQLQVFAAQASVALEHARLQQELQRLALVEDRERIGRELHDGAVQALFAVGMSLQAAEALTPDPNLRHRLDESVKQIDQVIQDLRNYIFGLRPGILADRELEQALRKLAADFEEEAGVTTVVDVDLRLSAELSNHAGDLVQVASEALSNVARHAGAMTCRLTLHREDGSAVLEVEDDGRGFDPRAPSLGQGLRNFRERAAALGGEVSISSQAGEGTTVQVRIPTR
ncbi:MAG: PAS domain S-box protein [Candidatus Dormibacterales bacterium]